MKISTGIVIKGISDLLAKAGSLITVPIIIRWAGADGYGAFTQVGTIVNFIIPFAALGFAGSIVRFFVKDTWTKKTRGQLMKIILVVFLTAGVCSLLMNAGASILNRLFLRWEKGVEIFCWGSPLIVMGAVEQIVLEFLRSRQHYVRFSLMQATQALATVGAVIVLLPFGYGIVGLLKAVIAIKLIAIILMVAGFWLWDRPNNTQTGLHDGTPALRQMAGFGLSVSIGGLGLWMMNVGDRLVIGHFMSADRLGLYGLIYAFSSLLVAAVSPLNLPLYPRLAHAILSHNAKDTSNTIRTFHRYITLCSVPSAVGLIVMMKWVLYLIGGVEFEIGMFLPICIVVAVFTSQWNTPAQYILLCTDQVIFSRNVWVAAGLLNILGNIILDPLIGLDGAALTTFVTFLLLDTVVFLKASAYVKLSALYRFDVAWRAIVSSIGASLVVLGIANTVTLVATKWDLVAMASIFCSTYIVIMVLIKGIDKRDFYMIGKSLSPVRQG